MAGKHWTAAEEDALWQMQDASEDQLCAQFPGRTPHAIRLKILSLRKQRRVGYSPPAATPASEGVTRTMDQTGLSVSGLVREEIKTLDDLFRVCAVDPLEWQVVSWTCAAWNSLTKNAASEAEIHQLYKVSAKLKPRREVFAVREAITALVDREVPAATVPECKDLEGGEHVLELSIPDTHMGKHAWADETGHEHYDTNIARELYSAAAAELLARALPLGIGEAILVVGNDLLHVDNLENTTTRGTRQDVDSRPQRTFRAAVDMTVATVDLLLQHVPKVRVPVVPGNHDALSCWMLGEVLRAYYRNTDRVAVINEPGPRTYIRIGKALVMLCHGDGPKREDLPLIMARERPVDWGECTSHEAHTGHIHHERVVDVRGVIVRAFPSLCPPDAWHSRAGYIGSVRAAHGLVWHPEDGLVATHVWRPKPC